MCGRSLALPPISPEELTCRVDGLISLATWVDHSLSLMEPPSAVKPPMGAQPLVPRARSICLWTVRLSPHLPYREEPPIPLRAWSYNRIPRSVALALSLFWTTIRLKPTMSIKAISPPHWLAAHVSALPPLTTMRRMGLSP